MSQICVKKKSKESRRRGRGRTPPEEDSAWKQVSSVRMGLFAVQDTSATGGDRSTTDHLHPPAGRERERHPGCNQKNCKYTW